jgi:hypothetical protein
MVILGHACAPTSLWARVLFAHAALGVRIFFIISALNKNLENYAYYAAF